jgi:hypothetical protein
MIAWPSDDKMNATSTENLARFRRTAVAKELEEDTHTWRFQCWAWTSYGPWKWILHSDTHRLVTLTMDEDGEYLVKYADPDLAGFAN